MHLSIHQWWAPAQAGSVFCRGGGGDTPTLQASLCWERTPRVKVNGGVWGVDACLGWEAFEGGCWEQQPKGAFWFCWRLRFHFCFTASHGLHYRTGCFHPICILRILPAFLKKCNHFWFQNCPEDGTVNLISIGVPFSKLFYANISGYLCKRKFWGDL